jgi:hypothetical protein
LIAFNTALEQDRKKKPKKVVEEPTTDVFTEEDTDQATIEDKNYEIYGDEPKIEENVEENINTFSDTEESVSITSKAPYYTLPDFDWDNKSLWINDRHAIKYWMRTQKGNQKDLDKLKEDEDFTQKSY